MAFITMPLPCDLIFIFEISFIIILCSIARWYFFLSFVVSIFCTMEWVWNKIYLLSDSTNSVSSVARSPKFILLWYVCNTNQESHFNPVATIDSFKLVKKLQGYLNERLGWNHGGINIHSREEYSFWQCRYSFFVLDFQCFFF